MRVNIHPFIAHVSVLRQRATPRVRAAVERALTARFDFVRDSASAVAAAAAQHHQVRRRGAAAPRKPPPPPQRQYVHRGGAAFVRADDAGGLVWIRNRLRKQPGQLKLLGELRRHARALDALFCVFDAKAPGAEASTVAAFVDLIANALIARPPLDVDAPGPTRAARSSSAVKDLKIERPASPATLDQASRSSSPTTLREQRGSPRSLLAVVAAELAPLSER